MKPISTIGQFPVYQMTKEVADTYADQLIDLADTIPLVNFTKEELLSESKKDRVFYSKWDHSLVVFDNDTPIALIIGYERPKEDNDKYPENSIYISELAVDKNYRNQGIAKELISLFLKRSNSFLYLDGRTVFAVQTNSAEWNKHVIKLYESFGFEQTNIKEYDNRTDVILKRIN